VRFFCLVRPVVFALIVVFTAPNAWAVIRVDAPVTHIYDLAKVVLIGKVVRVDASEKLVEVEIVKVSKGTFGSHRVQIELASVSDYLGHIELNQPVVIFSGFKSALVHLDDNFLSAESLTQAEPPKLIVKSVNPIQPRFPGRTAALVRLLDDIASGHPTLLNMIEHVVWNGGIIDRGKVLPNADYIITLHLNGGDTDDVLIGNSRSTQLLANTGKSLRDETLKWGLRTASGKWAASGDIHGDGRVDLLIGKQLWLNRGDHFTPGPVLSLPTTDDVAAVALLDVTGDRRSDAIFLTKDGTLYTFENPGHEGANWKMLAPKRLWNDSETANAAVFSNDWGDTNKSHVMVVRANGLTRYALDADGGPPADFERLTGQTLNAYNEIEQSLHWNVMAAVPLDINGDGHEDLIVILDKGGPTLVNRGFGTFFLNPLPTEALHSSYQKEVPWKIAPGTHFGAGDLHGDKFDDLLIVTPEGRLFELNNPPYERMSNRFQ
jgi:hypothetical protein